MNGSKMTHQGVKGYYFIKKAASSKSERKDLNGSLVTIKTIFGSIFFGAAGLY